MRRSRVAGSACWSDSDRGPAPGVGKAVPPAGSSNQALVAWLYRTCPRVRLVLRLFFFWMTMRWLELKLFILRSSPHST